MDLPEVENYDDDNLKTLKYMIEDEIRKREKLASIPKTIDDLNKEYLNTSGTVSGDPWVKPTGAFNAYPLEWRTSHADKIWESLVAANVWEPPTNWREVVAEGDPVADWVKPSGAEDSYSVGELVTFEGDVWKSIIDDNVWSPTEHPEGWENTTSTPIDTPKEWMKPTGSEDSYGIGDQVTFEGKVYESLIVGNTYSPTDYPAGWKLV